MDHKLFTKGQHLKTLTVTYYSNTMVANVNKVAGSQKIL